MSKKEDTVTTVTSIESPSTSSTTTTDPTTTRNRKPSIRQPAPENLSLDDGDQKNPNSLGVPVTERQDFPSPGSAPQGQHIFDANAVAEDRGVETVPGGWAEGVKEQEKLRDEYARQDGEKTGLKDKVRDLLHRD